MLIYYALYFVCFAGYYIALHIKSNKTKEQRIAISGWICFMGLAIVLAFRHQSMGVDLRPDRSYGYLGMFDFIGQANWNSIIHNTFLNYEKGYVVFCKLLSYISKDRQFLLIAVSFLSIVPICYVTARRSKSPVFSFVVYMALPLVQLLFSGLRQDIAIGLCFLSTEFIRKKKPVFFVLLVLVAASFHGSALCFLLAYPLYYMKIKKKVRIISVLGLIVVYVFRYPLFSFLASFVKTNYEITDTGAFRLLLIFIGLYLFCMVFSDDSDEQIGCLNLFYLSCFFQCFSGVNTLVMRMGFYFMPFIIILIPNVISGMANIANKRICRDTFVVLFFIYSLYVLHSTSYAQSYPYYFFWQSI